MTPTDFYVLIQGYYDDPLGFVRAMFPWGQKGTPLEQFPDGPDAWHCAEFLKIAEHVKKNQSRKILGLSQEPYQSAVSSGHGIGKSTMVAWLILWLMSTRRNCRGVVTANTGAQLEGKTWPELNKWHKLAENSSWFKITATQFFCTLEPDGEKNWKFDCVTWSAENTEAFAGLHNASSAVVFIFDEASAIDDPIWEVAEGGLTDGEPFWFAFGNPTQNTGRFRECFGKYRHRWHTRHVDSREVRITNKEQIAKWIEDYGDDSDFVRVRVKGQFPRGGSKQFIPVDLVEAAQTRELQPDGGAPLILGVDVARYGDDQSVLRFRRGRDARTIPPIKFRGLDNMELANRTAEVISRFNPSAVFIDAGNGTGVIDRLREMGYKVQEVWFGGASSHRRNCKNKRVEMWHDLKDWLDGGCIDGDQQLRDDLIGPEYTLTDTGEYLLEPKERMKKRGLASPDDGDALALTFAQRIARTDLKASRNTRNHRHAPDQPLSPFFPSL